MKATLERRQLLMRRRWTSVKYRRRAAAGANLDAGTNLQDEYAVQYKLIWRLGNLFYDAWYSLGVTHAEARRYWRPCRAAAGFPPDPAKVAQAVLNLVKRRRQRKEDVPASLTGDYGEREVHAYLKKIAARSLALRDPRAKADYRVGREWPTAESIAAREQRSNEFAAAVHKIYDNRPIPALEEKLLALSSPKKKIPADSGDSTEPVRR